jgi:M6 family metalloprotease-like protein
MPATAPGIHRCGSYLGKMGGTMKPVKLFAVMVAVMGLLFSYGVPGAAAPPRAQHALGVQRVLVLAVAFPDVPDVPGLGKIREHMLDEPAEYYALSSYGKTQLQGTIKGWYRLPRPLAEYKVAPENIQIDRRRVRRLVEDAFNAADKDVVFDRYDHVIIVVGVRTQPGVGYGSVSQSANPGTLQVEGVRHGRARMETIVTRGGQRFSGGIGIMAQNAKVGQVAHDLAHALGGVVDGKRVVPDLYDTILQGKVGPLSYESYSKFTVFMGPWDLMSRHLIEPQLPPPGMSSFTRLRMGWIGSDQVVEVTTEEKREVTLSSLADGKGTLVIKVPGPRGTYYLVENRQKSAGDPVVPATGILILHVDESREDGDGIVRVVDANPKVPDFGAATFGNGPGQTASALLQGNIAVQVLSQSGTDITVLITKTSRAP